MNFKEECWIIYGIRIKNTLLGYLSYESEGSPASVDFNWKKVFKNRLKIIGFNHTHPSGMPVPSTIDDTTMIGWVKTLGKPLICGIKEDKHKQNIYLYKRVYQKVHRYPVPFKKIGNFIMIRIGS